MKKKKNRLVAMRFSDLAIERIILRATNKTGETYDIYNAIRVMCEEEPVFAGPPKGNKNAKKKEPALEGEAPDKN